MSTCVVNTHAGIKQPKKDKKMKRIIVVLLCIGLMFGCATTRTNQDGSSEEIRIDMQSVVLFSDLIQSWLPLLQAMEEEKDPDLKEQIKAQIMQNLLKYLKESGDLYNE